MKASELWIDARMLRSSGIGVYLRSLLPDIFKQAQASQIPVRVFARPQDEAWIRAQSAAAQVDFQSCDIPIYSIKEQIFWFQNRTSKKILFWSPHYNIPIFLNAKLIVTVHDLAHLDLPEHQGILKKIYSKLMFRILVRRSSQIICVSQFTRSRLEHYFGPCPTAKVVHNGIDLARLKERDDKGLPAVPYLLFVGNLKPHKNIKTLIAAVENLNSKGHKLGLVIVGNLKNLSSVDEEVVRLIDTKKDLIFFAEDATDKELTSLYQNAMALVFPSLYEGFGFPPLEAMALGCPVIASDQASIPEIVGSAALSFPALDPSALSDKILELQNPKTRLGLIQAGQFQVQKFNTDLMIQKTLKILFQEFSA